MTDFPLYFSNDLECFDFDLEFLLSPFRENEDFYLDFLLTILWENFNRSAK